MVECFERIGSILKCLPTKCYQLGGGRECGDTQSAISRYTGRLQPGGTSDRFN